ncbi:cytochrome P450 708A2 [Brassica napus]|uniref:cytochrome P450 708A2 n=1 Tax=Brassica napus TaxID=3708 RepID=UPI000BBEAC01|nr:cytochrome P450 708A2 [Brassica napus]
MISNLKPETQEKLIDHFKTFNIEWFQSPFALSTWKTVYKVLRARKEAVKIINEALEKRKDSIEKQGDFLDTLLEEMKKEGSIFYKESIVSLLLNIGFVSRDSTSYATALTVNFISKNPRVLTELKREHEAIVQKRDDKEPGLSWEEYKNCMPFTRMVIYESLRLANLGTIIFRKAVKDVEVKGYTIPAGWIVAVAPSVVHYNSEIYENPLEFNPWRWEGKDLQSPGSKTLMVFGGGARQCIGSDLARLHLAVFIHHFVTTYDFSVVQECEICRVPFPFFTKDLVINISPKSPS